MQTIHRYTDSRHSSQRRLSVRIIGTQYDFIIHNRARFTTNEGSRWWTKTSQA